MAAGGRAAAASQRASVDLVEAAVLEDRVGEHFDAMAIDRMGDAAVEVELADPAVRAPCEGAGLELGRELSGRLVEADRRRRIVRFAPAA